MVLEICAAYAGIGLATYMFWPLFWPFWAYAGYVSEKRSDDL